MKIAVTKIFLILSVAYCIFFDSDLEICKLLSKRYIRSICLKWKYVYQKQKRE